MIILEGPDGAGKTTLISQLSRYLSFPVEPKAVNSDTSHAVDLKQYIQSTIINEQEGFSRKLYDRFALISGPIYAPIIKDEYQINLYKDTEWFSSWYKRFENLDPIVILCLPDLCTVINNVQDDPSNAKVSDCIVELYQEYRLWMLRNKCFVYDYKYAQSKGYGITKVIEYINNRLRNDHWSF